jgi:hypothetical protein
MLMYMSCFGALAGLLYSDLPEFECCLSELYYVASLCTLFSLGTPDTDSLQIEFYVTYVFSGSIRMIMNADAPFLSQDREMNSNVNNVRLP